MKLPDKELANRINNGCLFLWALAYGDSDCEIEPLMGDHACPWCGVSVPKDWRESDEEWHAPDCGLRLSIAELETARKELEDRTINTDLRLAARAITGYVREHPVLGKAYDTLGEKGQQEFFGKVWFLARHHVLGEG